MNKIVLEIEEDKIDCIAQSLRVYYGYLVQNEENAYGIEARESFKEKIKDIEILLKMFESIKTV